MKLKANFGSDAGIGGSHPIALAAAVLAIIVVGVFSIVFWRAYSGTTPEQERITSARQIQARAALVSEQLVEKTKGLEVSQQESIDQLQNVQGQLLAVKRLLTAQQADTKRLAEEVGGLTEAINTLRQSFASTQSVEALTQPSTRKTIRPRSRALMSRSTRMHRKRPKSQS